MTYKELQKALKEYKERGLTTVALNAKKDILQGEYDHKVALRDQVFR